MFFFTDEKSEVLRSGRSIKIADKKIAISETKVTTPIRKRKSSELIGNESKKVKHNQLQRIVSKPLKRTPLKRAHKMQLLPTFHPFELVWAYVKGYPKWPGVIEGMRPDGKYTIHFFGDYTRSYVTKKNIFHYFEGFSEFGNTFGNVRLGKAVQEAQIFLHENQNDSKACFVCKVLEFKKMYSVGRSLMM